MAAKPRVYIFMGADDSAIRSEVSKLISKLGEPATAEMNTTRLEGNPSLDALRRAALAAPFLAERRLVIASQVSKAFTSAEARKPFVQFLDELPPSAALVLLENSVLEDKHWLMKWTDGAEGRGFVREFNLPQGAQLANWLVVRARELGGELLPPAAAALAQLQASDRQAAENELHKLLAYAAYQRPISVDDVQRVCLSSGEHGDFFALADALSANNGTRAMQALLPLLEERDLILLYFSMVGHFRGLLQSRDLLDAGRNEADIAKQLHMHPYRAKKLAAQARLFSAATLERIYARLQAYDEQIKTGEMEPALAMQTFVAELSLANA
ncbi:MAG: DNA polymerase III subunit delta [Anaerolineales bacterium]|nr:DNA polymerase III subunit delta [Anaerolineales bacterium]